MFRLLFHRLFLKGHSLRQRWCAAAATGTSAPTTDVAGDAHMHDAIESAESAMIINILSSIFISMSFRRSYRDALTGNRRGAEMTRWRWQSTPDGPSCMRFDGVKRLIYMLFQSTKTSRAAQKDKYLIKYLGEELSILFVAFSFVRRLEILFSISMDMPDTTKERLQSYIFVVHGLPLSPLYYSQILRKIGSRFNLPSMGLREWRQVAIAFGKYHLQRFSEFRPHTNSEERHFLSYCFLVRPLGPNFLGMT